DSSAPFVGHIWHREFDRLSAANLLLIALQAGWHALGDGYWWGRNLLVEHGFWGFFWQVVATRMGPSGPRFSDVAHLWWCSGAGS
ncbi:MAG: hypothetical protein ACC652_12960, partial [Acidimicrobiales bacterium]